MKRIVVCCDGTWNADDSQTDDTNVAILTRAIHGSQQTDGILQIVLYLRGVGTTGLKLETWIEGATGVGVDDNIRSAYQFIAQNYIPGDEIYLFGFSRGAFTVRSLAGLITACGILFRQSLNALPNAWVYYRSEKPHSPQAFATRYSAQTHLDSSITFLGVWDTVGSLGIPGSLLAASNKERFAFHDTNPSPLVKRAVQALAIDEHGTARFQIIVEVVIKAKLVPVSHRLQEFSLWNKKLQWQAAHRHETWGSNDRRRAYKGGGSAN